MEINSNLSPRRLNKKQGKSMERETGSENIILTNHSQKREYPDEKLRDLECRFLTKKGSKAKNIDYEYELLFKERGWAPQAIGIPNIQSLVPVSPNNWEIYIENKREWGWKFWCKRSKYEHVDNNNNNNNKCCLVCLKCHSEERCPALYCAICKLQGAGHFTYQCPYKYLVPKSAYSPHLHVFLRHPIVYIPSPQAKCLFCTCLECICPDREGIIKLLESADHPTFHSHFTHSKEEGT